MKLRLLLRRLTVSAPRMAVRSALPWPVRWAGLAVVAGFCAAIALWSFEFGKEIAGLDYGNKEQLQQARTENGALQKQVQQLTDERNRAQSIANTADTRLTAEKAAQEKLLELNHSLQAQNQQLRDDLGFFEQLLPSSGADAAALTIRGLQVARLPSGELQWQVLIIQGAKNPPQWDGQLELVFAGTSAGKPWTGRPPAGTVPIKVKQYGRLQGLFAVPAQTIVKSVTVRLMQGAMVRAQRSVKI